MNKLIVKANELVNASYTLSLLEQRIILSAISQLDSKSQINEDNSYKIRASELLGISSGNNYVNLKNASKRLIRRVVTVDINSDTTVEFPWLSLCKYLHNEGAVEIQFNKNIIPYLSDLRNRFTQYRLKYIQNFKSIHSIRIYEILISWQSTEYCYIGIDELRAKLQLTNKYKLMADFQKAVIVPAINEINKHSDISVNYKKRKAGRTITGFEFHFTKKPAPVKPKTIKAPAPIPEIDPEENHLAAMRNMAILKARQDKKDKALTE